MVNEQTSGEDYLLWGVKRMKTKWDSVTGVLIEELYYLEQFISHQT